MPRIQYVSSRGVFHFHGIDAPTRTIPIDQALAREHRQRSAISRIPATSGMRTTPQLRAIVLNRANPPLTTMAPEHIDLTGSDDEPPSKDAQARPSSQLTPSNGRRSAVSFLKRSTQPEDTPNSSQRRNGSMEQTDRYAPSKNNQSANQRASLNGSSQQSSRLGMSQTQNTQSRRARETGVSSSYSSRSTNQNSQKREPEIVDLIDDEVRLPKFRMPPGYESNSSAKSPNKSAGLGRPFDGSSVVGRKRSLERDSPLNGFSTSKRPKVVQRDSERGSTPNAQSESRNKAKGPREATNKPAERSLPKSRSSGVLEQIDLRSPPRARTQGTPQHVRGQVGAALTQDPKSTSGQVVESVFMPSTKSTRDQLSSSDPNGFSKNFPTSQHHRSRKSSPKPSPSTGRSESLTLREQRAPGKGSEAIVNGSISPLGYVGTPSQEHGSTADRRMGTSKHQFPAINKTNGIENTSRHQRSFRRDRRDRSDSPETSEKVESVDARNQDSPRQRNVKDQVSPLASNDLEQRDVRIGTYPNSATKPVRKISAEEDQGDVSLRSGSRDRSRRTNWKELETVNRPERETQADSTFTSSKSTNSPRKVHGNDKSVAVDGLLSDKRAPESRKSHRPANVTKASMTPGSDKSPSRGTISFSRVQWSPDVSVPSTGAKSKPDGELAAESGTDVTKSTDCGVDEATSNGPFTRETITEAEEADFQLRSEAMQGAVENEMAGDVERAFVPPTISASALKASCVYSTLPLANRVEKVLGRYFEELRGDNEYWTSVSMRRARLTKEEELHEVFSEPSKANPEELTSFGHLQPLRLSLHKKGSFSTRSEEDIWGIQKVTTDGKPQAHVEMLAPYVNFSTDQQDVPNYAHYVSIKNNILAPNVIHLHCWPYFGDDFDTNKAHNLHDQYKIDIRERERKLLLLLKAQKYEDYVESALHELECSWSDVLRFLLEKEPDVGSDLGARKAYENRPQYCQDDFSRTSDRWVAVRNSLPPSSPEKLGRVAVLCENFQKMAKFSLWHIARKSDFAKLPEKVDTPAVVQPSDNELTCRICLRFNCPYHGYFKHRADDSGSESDGESVSSVDSVVATDIIHPLKANYRSRVAFPPDPPTASMSIEQAPVKKKQKDPNYWSGYRHKAEERGPFYPCYHPGISCEDANCRCSNKMVPCEKSCSCAPDCARKFKGCSCGSKKGHKLVCFEDVDCVCWQLGRECDPDLCGSCGVCDVVDPVNKYNDSVLIGRCRNASIQRGVPKHTLLGDSGVHGLGLYACENIRQNDFVGEYKGEIIAKKEADRRGAVYEHQKLSYLFSLNKAQEIDSTYFGNKVRFINHAHGEKANLYPRIIMVNTVHRIALYAGKDILAGKELLFDYGPYFPDEQLQGKKSKKSAPPESKKSAPHVRNANLVKEFYDVEESEDEDGILRAKAVSHSATGTKSRTKGKKPRGGARSGACRKPNYPKVAHRETLPDSYAEQGKGPDAGVRLAAFNISDDIPSEAMDLDAEWGAEDDEAFEPEGSESDDSEESDSERSEFEDEEEELGHTRGHRRRGVVNTRRNGRG